MKEHPILFNADMVRAILDGRKTQTRRLVKLTTLSDVPCLKIPYTNGTAHRHFPDYNCADRLWVREKFSNGWTTTPVPGDKLCYAASDLEEQGFSHVYRWWPSIHMPKWASRITLEITKIRVQRIQEVSEADAKEEGVNRRGDFQLLWSDIYGIGAWNNNPWVWAISFRRIT